MLYTWISRLYPFFKGWLFHLTKKRLSDKFISFIFWRKNKFVYFPYAVLTPLSLSVFHSLFLSPSLSLSFFSPPSNSLSFSHFNSFSLSLIISFLLSLFPLYYIFLLSFILLYLYNIFFSFPAFCLNLNDVLSLTLSPSHYLSVSSLILAED